MSISWRRPFDIAIGPVRYVTMVRSRVDNFTSRILVPSRPGGLCWDAGSAWPGLCSMLTLLGEEFGSTSHRVRERVNHCGIGYRLIYAEVVVGQLSMPAIIQSSRGDNSSRARFTQRNHLIFDVKLRLSHNVPGDPGRLMAPLFVQVASGADHLRSKPFPSRTITLLSASIYPTRLD